jgi:signal transduction histidine kinase
VASLSGPDRAAPTRLSREESSRDSACPDRDRPQRAAPASGAQQHRTPLAGLRLRLEAALDRPDTDLRPAIRAGLTEAVRLEPTIDELLALARNTPGPQPSRST